MYYYRAEKNETGLWLVEDKYNWIYTNKNESVYTTANGYIGVRASGDFRGLNDSRGMFVSGLFGKAAKDEVTELINCPDVVELEVIADGEKLSLDTSKIHTYSRKYNVYTGEVVMECVCQMSNGLELSIKTNRFASLSNRHMFCQKVIIKPLNQKVESLKVSTGINGQITNSGAAHIRNTECRVYDKKHMHYIGHSDDSKLDILMAVNMEGVEEGPFSFVLKRRSIYGNRTVSLEKDQSLEITKFVHIYTDLDREISEQEKINGIDSISNESYEDALDKHKEFSDEFWKYAKIDIEGITLEDEAAICFSQYQLYGMTPYNTDKASIAAKGLSGEGYKGHVFWDTEIYMLPFYYYTYPEVAKNLLMYRYNGLAGAREKAKEYGYEGAMYPWESAADGKEETPLFAALNIHTGKANPVWSGRKEHHVTADIIFALMNYYRVTGDEEFMFNYGIEMLVETSKFWISRAVEKNGRLEILDIIGPDEYDEHIDNNAFTNYMARYNVIKTLEMLAKVKKSKSEVYDNLWDRLELEKWIPKMENFVESIYLPVPNKEGIMPQDDTFLSKKELPNIEKYRKALVKQSVLLDYSRDEVVDMQVLKQADVVMLLNLFPALFDAETVKKNVLFYESRTLHDSSLSYCAHAQACANIGEVEMSKEFFRKALEIDLVDNPYDSVDGLHSASLGGIWNCIIQGFAGLSVDETGIKFNPHLPEEWKSISFYIKEKGQYKKVIVTKDNVNIEVL